jgi:hypothetical protein
MWPASANVQTSAQSTKLEHPGIIQQVRRRMVFAQSPQSDLESALLRRMQNTAQNRLPMFDPRKGQADQWALI